MGLIFGHDFQGRYSTTEGTVPVTAGEIEAVTEGFDWDEGREGAIRSLRGGSEIYHGDVCTRCGAKVSLNCEE